MVTEEQKGLYLGSHTEGTPKYFVKYFQSDVKKKKKKKKNC